MSNYNPTDVIQVDGKPHGDWGDVMTKAEWLDCVEQGSFIDYDGFGQALIERDDKLLLLSTFDFFPTDRFDLPPETTHIIWYNR